MADAPGSFLTGVRVCASVAAPTVDELASAAARCRDADLVEIRWDSLAGQQEDPAAIAALIGRVRERLLFTCRPAWQGGGYTGSEETRRALLAHALAAGARWVDVELDAPFCAALVEADRHRVLVSHHWSRPRPADLEERLARIAELRPAIGKLVAPAEAATDAVPLMAAADRLRAAEVFPACFVMGEAGRASRLLSVARSGGLLYVARHDSAATAPGQWTLDAVRHELRVGRWQPGRRIYGLIGDPIDHSLSPTIFNAAFAAAGRPACYVPIPGSDLDDVLALAEASGVDGLSVTMPFKEAAAARCVRLHGIAAEVGAVNTLVREPAGWVGHNTDGAALVAALADHRDPAGASVLLVGAGGAARSAAAALRDAGAHVTIVNRTRERADRLAAQIGCSSEAIERVPDLRFDVLVNATPVGMDATAGVPVPTAGLRGDEVVLEMIYRPADTELLRQARSRGCMAVPGIAMFLRQAVAQHRLWTGESPPPGSLRKAAVERLEADRFR